MKAIPPGGRSLLAYAVIASSGFNASLTKVFDHFSARPDWCVAAVAALVMLGAGPWRSAEDWRRLLQNRTAVALVVFVAVHIAASIVNAAWWPMGLKFMNVYLLGLAAFLAVLYGIQSWRALEVAVRVLVGVGAIVAVWGGLAAMASNIGQQMITGAHAIHVVRTTVEVEPIRVVHRHLVFAGRGGLLEPNILGSFLLAPLALALWSWRDRPSDRFPFRAASLVIVFGLVAALTRAAWLGGAAIVLVWVWRRRPRLTALAALVGVAALSVLALQASLLLSTKTTSTKRAPASPNIAELRVFKPLVERRDFDLVVRSHVNGAVFENWRAGGPIAWLLGRGSGSTNAINFKLQIGKHRKRLPRLWTGNAFLMSLHDAGILGLAALTGLVATVAAQLYSMVHRAPLGRAQGLCQALAVSAAALLFAYQFTHAMWQMSTYVFLGLVVALSRLLEAEALTPASRGGDDPHPIR